VLVTHTTHQLHRYTEVQSAHLDASRGPRQCSSVKWK